MRKGFMNFSQNDRKSILPPALWGIYVNNKDPLERTVHEFITANIEVIEADEMMNSVEIDPSDIFGSNEHSIEEEESWNTKRNYVRSLSLKFKKLIKGPKKSDL